MPGVPNIEADADDHSGCDENLCTGGAVVADGVVGALVVLVRGGRGQGGRAGGEQESVRPRLLIRGGQAGFQINHLMGEPGALSAGLEHQSVRLGQNGNLAEKQDTETRGMYVGERRRRWERIVLVLYINGTIEMCEKKSAYFDGVVLLLWWRS